MFTSVSSLRAHHAHGAVNWQVVRGITPGIIAGTLGGTVVAAQLSTTFLKVFFVVFLYYVATQMIMNIKPKPSRELPGKAGMFGAGSAASPLDVNRAVQSATAAAMRAVQVIHKTASTEAA